MTNFIYQYYKEETDEIINEILGVSDEILEKHPEVIFRGIGELPFLMRCFEDRVTTREIDEEDWLQILDDQHYTDRTKIKLEEIKE